MHRPVVRNALSNLLQGQNLQDSWRLVHPEEKSYTWSRVQPPTAKRLDYIFTSESMSSYITDSGIKSVGFTDHRMVISNFIFSTFKRGKGMFKLNTSVLKDIEYCRIIIREIHKTQLEYNNVNPHLLWEMIKINIKEITQIYCKSKKREREDREHELRQQLQELEDQYTVEGDNEALIQNVGKIKAELEIFEMEVAKGVQIRARMQDINEG